ncbi:MAG: hypothetical protein AAGL11_05595 [Pseudomonadota bacterium]
MLKLTSRRTFLASSASVLALAGGCSGAEESSGPTIETVEETAPLTPMPEITADDIADAELMSAEFGLDPINEAVVGSVAPITGGEESKAGKIRRARQQLRTQPDKTWFYWSDDDADSFDYSHLVAMGETVGESEVSTGLETEPFDLTPELLQTLVDANYFEHSIATTLSENEKANGRVIVALRGAEIVNAGTEEDPTIRLRDRRPSHREPHCVYTVWHRQVDAPDTLAVFEGATVPSELYLSIFQALRASNLKSSMMPQGFHLRRLDNMRLSATNTHSNTLRQASPCPVIREPDPERDAFSMGHSEWDPSSSDDSPRSVGAHIHAGYWDNREGNSWRDWRWKFSSAGCQTICGSVSNETARRDISDFYTAMDIPEAELVDEAFTSDKYGTIYPMVLLSGREARMHAEGAPMSAMRRIRFGSSIDAEAEPDHPIIQVQEALGVTADGQFGGGSMLKLIDVQRAGSWMIGSAADGIVTPDLVASQDIDLG